MGKLLFGKDIAGFVKERQAGVARGKGLSLAIVRDNQSPVIEKYVRLKQKYGEDIGVKVEDFCQKDVPRKLSEVGDFTGVIVQLPLVFSGIDEAVAATPASKDVDGLRADSPFVSATATAINWLLAGHNVDLPKRKIAVVGVGRLVGGPLVDMWRKSGLTVEVFRSGSDLAKLIEYDLVVSATGVPGLIKSEYLQAGAVAIDAGTTSESGEIVGDFAPEIYDRDDLILTPKVGGVGPLTIAALFENILAAGQTTS